VLRTLGGEEHALQPHVLQPAHVAAEVVADEQLQCTDVVELHVEQELCFIRRV
jgi:hypothetical protein